MPSLSDVARSTPARVLAALAGLALAAGCAGSGGGSNPAPRPAPVTGKVNPGAVSNPLVPDGALAPDVRRLTADGPAHGADGVTRQRFTDGGRKTDVGSRSSQIYATVVSNRPGSDNL